MANNKYFKNIAYGIIGFSLANIINKPELIEPTIMDFLPDAALVLALPTASTTDESLEGGGDKPSETKHKDKHK